MGEPLSQVFRTGTASELWIWLGRRIGRETEAVSTSNVQPDPAFSWKQEVSRSITAHQSRRGLSAVEPAREVRTPAAAGSRAAMVAARVAAHYAQVPSFSQMQAAEAHAALRAAEVATQAALEANAAAQAALASLQAAAAAPRQPEPKVAPSPSFEPAQPAARGWEPTLAPAQIAAPSSLEAWENECSRVHGETDFRLRPLNPVSAPVFAPAPRQPEDLAATAEDRWEPASPSGEPWGAEDFLPVEPAQPIHANLIEFPRELIATRKMRPRLAEGPFAEEGLERQLSIFEVEPEEISTEPEEADATPASAWQQPEWSGIKLDAQPLDEPEPGNAPDSQPILQQASGSRRLMAVLVDGMLLACVLLGLAVAVAKILVHPPAARIMELSVVAALVLAGLLYQTLFLTLGRATPGMRCACISFCTFDGQIPTRKQLRGRLGALLLSIVPVGLGIAWALFDDDHLCWHDRLSRTYLRRC